MSSDEYQIRDPFKATYTFHKGSNALQLVITFTTTRVTGRNG